MGFVTVALLFFGTLSLLVCDNRDSRVLGGDIQKSKKHRIAGQTLGFGKKQAQESKSAAKKKVKTTHEGADRSAEQKVVHFDFGGLLGAGNFWAGNLILNSLGDRSTKWGILY